jgi:hypothetical protein
MIVEFQDANGESAHSDFQKWRRGNEGGFFINVKAKNDLMLHRVSCSHPGGTEWEREEHEKWGSLTQNRKVCSNDVQKLQNWAKEKDSSAQLKTCGTCKPL